MRSSLPKSLIQQCLNDQAELCNHCKVPLKVKERLQDVDHRTPYSLVQRHERSNLQILCLECHRKKTIQDTKLIQFAKTTTEHVCFTCHRVVSKQFTHEHK